MPKYIVTVEVRIDVPVDSNNAYEAYNAARIYVGLIMPRDKKWQITDSWVDNEELGVVEYGRPDSDDTTRTGC